MNPLIVRLGLNSKDFNAGMLAAMKDIKQVRKNTDDLAGSMKTLNAVAKTAFSAWGIYNVREALQGLVRYVGEVKIEMDRMSMSMTAATGSLKLGTDAMKFLQEESQRLGLTFRTQLMGFQQLAAAAKGTKITYETVKEIFLGIAEASTVMQLTNEQNKFALYALQQMISKGVVTMEELRRQLGDQIPGAFQIAARAMGVTTQELIKLVSTGNLLSEEFVPKFAKQLREEMAGSVEDASKTIYANINRLKNIFYSFGNDIAEYSGGIDVFNKYLKEFIETISDEKTQQSIINFSKGIVGLAHTFTMLGKVAKEIVTVGGLFDIFDLFDKFAKIPEANSFKIGKLLEEIKETENRIQEIKNNANAYNLPISDDILLKDELNKLKELKKELKEVLEIRSKITIKEKEYIDVWQTRIEQEKEYLDLWRETIKPPIDPLEWEETIGKVDRALTGFFASIDKAEDNLIKNTDRRLKEEFKWLDAQEKKYNKIEAAAKKARDAYLYDPNYKDAWMPGGRNEKYAEERSAAETRALEESLKEQKEIYDTFIQNIQNALSSTFKDIFKGNIENWSDMLDRMKDLFLDMLAELAAAALTKKISLSMQGSVGANGQQMGIGNVFGNNTYNVGASAIGGALIGQSNQGSYLQGVAGGAAQGYMIGGPWGALGGALGAGISGLFGGDKNFDQGHVFHMRENWASGFFGSAENEYKYYPTYGRDRGALSGDEAGIQVTNSLIEEKRKLTLQYKQILEQLPLDMVKDIRDEVGKINLQWSGDYNMTIDQFAKTFVEKYNSTFVGAIGDNIESFIAGQESFSFLDQYTKDVLFNPIMRGSAEDPNFIANFANLEDILEALKYLEQVKITWRDISLIAKQATGESVAYQMGINNINDSFDQMIDTLQNLGFTTDKINEIESQRALALKQYEEQLAKSRTDILDQWLVLSGSLTDEQAQILDLRKQYESAKQSLIDLNATTNELATLDELYNMSISNIKTSFNEITDLWDKFFNNIMGDLAPVQSAEFYGGRLSDLYSKATSEEGISKLYDFITSEYLPYMKTYGDSDYNMIWESVKNLAGGIPLNGQTISSYGGFDYSLLGNTIGQSVSAAISGMQSNDKIIVQIGDQVLAEFIISELKSNNTEMVTEIRRIVENG